MDLPSLSPFPMVGSVPETFNNELCLYEGNLSEYFPILLKAQNVNAPYHNLRHMLHVTVMCYSALLFERIKAREKHQSCARDLMVAALFHDMGHTGENLDDIVNINRGLYCLDRAATKEDEVRLHNISAIIRGSLHPLPVGAVTGGDLGRFLRDADRSQAFSTAWIQQIGVGLAKEKGWTFQEALEQQIQFLSSLQFETEWGQWMFQSQIPAKIEETKQILLLSRL